MYKNRKLVPTIFLFDDTVAFNDAKEMGKNKKNLYNLCKHYEIKIFKVIGQEEINAIDDIKNIKFDISEFNY